MTELTSSVGLPPAAAVADEQDELSFLSLLPTDSALLAMVCQKVSVNDAPTKRWLEYLLKKYSALSKRRLVPDLRALTVLQWLVVPISEAQDEISQALWSRLYASALSC
ncbi:Hypothetical protein, putative [Bodo saltans]|uniref:Uncharacterized protein n=1 Tax=Bodo saltans TaxID=75058 RepID=A0A0S4IZS9_BODSA|nr:Hypothetical protein, putative [Bodo saltans]|eukprot:CUG36909.1 Hypothetical protein, putative [Bodo saltans]